MLEGLNVDDFESFLTRLFPRVTTNAREYVDVGEDGYAVIRMFVFGCLNEMADRNIGLLFHLYVDCTKCQNL